MKRSLAAIIALVGLGATMAGCYGVVEIDSCGNPERVYVSPDGRPDPCIRCLGECVARPELPWSAPSLVWFGPTDETPPPCPVGTSNPSTIGFADLVASMECAPCTCGPPSGSCAMPTSITAYAAACPGTGAWTTSFDGPAGWDGSCTSANAIPQGKNCGGAPCVQSLTVEPLSVVEGDCPALVGPAPQPVGPIYWKSQTRACVGPVREDLCGANDLVCVPSAEPPPPGYQHCVYREGDRACPVGYPERHVVYEGFVKNYSCSACECGPPSGSLCSAAISFFQDDACSLPLPLTIGFTSAISICTDVGMPGTALGSKSISNITYQPGTCQASGGEPIGSIDPSSPATVCCIPQDDRQ